MNNLAAIGIAFIAALALWKGTKERWFPAFIGMLVIVFTVKYSFKADDAGDNLEGWLILIAGSSVFTAGVYGLKWYDKRTEAITKSNPGHILAKKKSPEPDKLLWCSGNKADGKNGHFMGPNEPYRFLYTDGTRNGNSLREDGWDKVTREWDEIKPDKTGNSGLVCLDCIQKSRKESDDWSRGWDEEKEREFEWNAMSETDREIRRTTAKQMSLCPRCLKLLNAKDGEPSNKFPREGSCPMCREIPSNPKAPMHKVKRIVEFASLSESEWRTREGEAIAFREKNLSEWCVKGGDGIWRRKDNGEIVNA